MNTITTAAETTFAAFAAEHAAASQADSALRTFATVCADALDSGVSGASILKDAKAARPDVKDQAVRKAHGLPTNAAAVRGLIHVGEILRLDDDLEVLFDIRQAWALATAVANAAKFGGGSVALSCTLGDADTVSEAFDALVKAERAVAKARRAAAKAEPEVDETPDTDGADEGTDEVTDEVVVKEGVLHWLQGASGSLAKAAEARVAGTPLTDEERALAHALVAHLDTILAPESVSLVTSTPAVVTV